MRARRTDANHRQLLEALRRCGWAVVSTHVVGGFVDAVAWHPSRGVRLLEFKQPKGTLTASQRGLLADGWPVVIVRSVDEAAALR
jgi:hypothetical protein